MAYRLGRRSSPFARYGLLLFDDRVEEVSYTLAGLEVKRFFFDEADYLTVHRVSNAGEIVLAAVAGVIMGAFAVGTREMPGFVVFFGVLAVLFVVLALLAYVSPPYKLVLAAPSPEMAECTLPRSRGRREEAIGRLTRAIARYQARTARPPGPPEEVPPPGPEPAAV
jgi:hypothetical protein